MYTKSMQENGSSSRYWTPFMIYIKEHTFPVPSTHSNEKSWAPFSIESYCNKTDKDTAMFSVIWDLEDDSDVEYNP